MGILQFRNERTTLALIESTLVIKEQSWKVNSDIVKGHGRISGGPTSPPGKVNFTRLHVSTSWTEVGLACGPGAIIRKWGKKNQSEYFIASLILTTVKHADKSSQTGFVCDCVCACVWGGDLPFSCAWSTMSSVNLWPSDDWAKQMKKYNVKNSEHPSANRSAELYYLKLSRAESSAFISSRSIFSFSGTHPEWSTILVG